MSSVEVFFRAKRNVARGISQEYQITGKIIKTKALLSVDKSAFKVNTDLFIIADHFLFENHDGQREHRCGIGNKYNNISWCYTFRMIIHYAFYYCQTGFKRQIVTYFAENRSEHFFWEIHAACKTYELNDYA